MSHGVAPKGLEGPVPGVIWTPLETRKEKATQAARHTLHQVKERGHIGPTCK